ncbi:MAG: DUF188 domain-containing protein [Spirochaetaceae bacterium]|nr:DUF188 domain-containing protein [Spirochaetaceae bacterium]
MRLSVFQGALMTVWIDADSMSREIRAILIRQAETMKNRKTQRFALRFVAAVAVKDVPEKYFTQVEPGVDAADHYIEQNVSLGDIVVTRDIPFAERLLARDIAALNDRGDIFSKDTIAQRRSLRDAAVELRLLGIAEESPKSSTPRSPADIKRFSDALDKLVTKVSRDTQLRYQ